jgi:hypothetical protein
MKRYWLIALVLLLFVYLWGLVTTGQEFLSFANPRPKLMVERPPKINASLEEPLAIRLQGQGFGADTRAFLQLDVNNQDAIIGSLPIDHLVHDMELIGNTLFMGGNSGLMRVDVSDPAKPQLYPHPVKKRATILEINRFGDLLFISCGLQGIYYVEVSENGKLRNWRRLNTWSVALSSTVVGNYLYVASGKRGLLVYALDELANNEPVAVIEAEQPVRSIKSFANCLYTVEGSRGVRIYCLDQNGMPRLTNQLPVTQVAKDLEIKAGYLYLLEKGKLSKYDLSDPENPQLLSSQDHFANPHRMHFADDTIYVSDNESGLGIVHEHQGHFTEKAQFFNAGGDPRDMVSVGPYLYVILSNRQLKIVDPAAILPRQVTSSIAVPGPITDVKMHGDFLYFAGRSGIYRKPPTLPEEEAKLLSSQGGGNLSINGDWLWGAGWKDGLELWNISTPDAPALKAYRKDIFAAEVAMGEGYLVTTHPRKGIVLFDASSPDSLIELDRVDGIYAHSVAIHDGIVIVAGEKEGLSFYRIEDGKLVFISRLKLPFPLADFASAFEFEYVDGIIYVANGEAGLLIVDLKTPAAPKILSLLRLPGFANDVRVEGQRAYLTSRYGGLFTIDVSNNASPRLLSSIAIHDLPGGIDRHNDLIYLSNRHMGVAAIPVPSEVETEILSSEELRLKVVPPSHPGRYSLQITNADGSVTLSSLLSYQ